MSETRLSLRKQLLEAHVEIANLKFENARLRAHIPAADIVAMRTQQGGIVTFGPNVDHAAIEKIIALYRKRIEAERKRLA